MTRKPWYCPRCHTDVSQWGERGMDLVDPVHRACGGVMLLNGTSREAWARLGNALSELGRSVKHAARDDWAWIRRKVRR